MSTALLTATAARIADAREQAPELWAHILAANAAGRSVAGSIERVWASSEFVAYACSRDPSLLRRLADDASLFEHKPNDWIAQDLGALMEGAGEAASEQQWMQGLRNFRKRHMVRIAWRDIAGWAGLDETLGDLSALADSCIEFAYERMYALLVQRYGVPRGAESGEPQPLMILGMGKLGGCELNFSSDIDLVLLYPEDGETDGSRGIDNAEFFMRLGQKLVQLLSAPTAEGIVYRVDLRLRPFGDSGRLALSFDSFENYLQQHGRDWERYAYVKARAVTAKDRFDELYEQMLRPFVYRRYLDFSVFESLRDMKTMIAKEVERRELQDNIKLGPGGIREIEFIVQAFQLIRGGNDRRLQSRELRKVLPLLSGQRLLRQRAVSELDAAYRFLRMVENRLQEWNDEQTHRLPCAADELARMALSLGMVDGDAFSAELTGHRRRVAHWFARTVFGPAVRMPDSANEAHLAFHPDSVTEDRVAALKRLGADNPAPLAAVLDRLQASVYFRQLDEIGMRRLRELLPRILEIVAPLDSAEVAFTRITKVLEMIGGRTVYLALLNENAIALRRLVQLCARSQFLADQVAAHPLLLDELLDEQLFDVIPTRQQFEADLAVLAETLRIEDGERQMEMLRQFQRAAMFKVAVADLTGKLPLMRVSDRLTDIAELIVDKVLQLAWSQIVAKHGEPRCGEQEASLRIASMIVVAYGKMGGLEMGYSSDLDLVFLHDSAGEIQRSDGPQALENSLFFQRLAQRMVHLLTVHTSAGRLYEVDMRLRPGGSKGLLAQTFESFKEYEFKEAWTWEHQSLLRARAVAGDPSLRAAFEAARVDVLCKAVRRNDLKDEVRNMRTKMRENLSKPRPGKFNLKQGAGGVADLEFLVQFWVLNWAERHPRILTYSDNIRQLEGLAELHLIPAPVAEFLATTYRRYRERMHHLSLDGASSSIDDSEFVEERRGVSEIWREVME